MKRTLVPPYCISRLRQIVMLIYDVIVVQLSHTYWIVSRLLLVCSLFVCYAVSKKFGDGGIIVRK